MLEYFVHLDSDNAPADLLLVTTEIPDDVSRERIAAHDLPSFWRKSPAPADLARIGNEFARRAKHCILIVPSALALNENNWILNPQHAGFRRIVLSELEPLRYDPRMFVQRGRRRSRLLPVFFLRGHLATTVVEIPPRGRKSPFTSAHTGLAHRTTSFSTWFTTFS